MMTTTTKAPPFACIALIAGVFLPVGASAQGCALIHPVRLPPVSQCYETVKLTIGEIMSLFKDLDLSSFELVSARYERYREDGCPLDERSALGHPQDSQVVTREIETFTKAVRVGNHLCKVKVIGSYGLDEDWRLPKARGEAYLARVIGDDTATCEQFALNSYVLLRDPIPDQAVVTLLQQSKQVLQAVAVEIGMENKEVCIRGIGIDEPSPLVSSYYFAIRPAPYKVYVSFNPESELVISELRR